MFLHKFITCFLIYYQNCSFTEKLNFLAKTNFIYISICKLFLLDVHNKCQVIKKQSWKSKYFKCHLTAGKIYLCIPGIIYSTSWYQYIFFFFFLLRIKYLQKFYSKHKTLMHFRVIFPPDNNHYYFFVYLCLLSQHCKSNTL